MMKKTAMITAVLCAAYLLCAGSVFAQGLIREISGTVELKQSGQTAFVPARVGDQVARNTIISTGFRSTALISSGSAVIAVRPLTRLSLDEIASGAGTETINVSLQTGRVRVNVNPPLGTRTTMSVRGPSATASVRGTSFEFDTRNISVESGTVVFQGSKGGVMLVSAGSTSTMTEDDQAADPIVTSALELVPPSPSSAGDSGINTDSAAPSTDEFTLTLVYN